MKAGKRLLRPIIPRSYTKKDLLCTIKKLTIHPRQALGQILALRPLRVHFAEVLVQRVEPSYASEMAPRVVVIRAEDPLDVAMRGLGER